MLNKVMGKRVSLHYEEKVGLPTSCFGETRHYVTRVTGVEEIPIAPGIVVPTPAAASRAAVIAVIFLRSSFPGDPRHAALRGSSSSVHVPLIAD